MTAFLRWGPVGDILKFLPNYMRPHGVVRITGLVRLATCPMISELLHRMTDQGI